MMEFHGVVRREFNQRVAARIGSHAVHIVHWRHGLYFFNQRLSFGFPSALQVGIHQEIHRMELVSFTAHAHGGRFPRGGDRSKIGIDIVLPQPDSGKNM